MHVSHLALLLGLGAGLAAPWTEAPAAPAAPRDKASISPPFDFDGAIPRAVLERYLSRAITQMGLTHSEQQAEDIRMLAHIGAKFIGRAALLWGDPEADQEAYFRRCAETVRRAHQADPDMLLEACLLEIVTNGFDRLRIPDWVFQAFDLPPEGRCFRYADMLYDRGRQRDAWGKGQSIPDMSKLETRLWFYYRARRYIDAGFEAIHVGQVHIMDQADPGHRHWQDLFNRVRAYGKQKARRHRVLINAHTHGIVEDGRLLFDFHNWPVRPREVAGTPMQAVLAKTSVYRYGNIDAIYGRSKGGIAPSGWTCDHLPYIVEIDNWDTSRKGGQSIGPPWVWGYDEISWFARLAPEARDQWLRYAWAWVRENDPNGRLEMPGRRCLADPIDGVAAYYANTRSAAAPRGFGQEETIKAIWRADR